MTIRTLRTRGAAAVPALRAGLAASGLTTAAVLLDQALLGSLATRLAQLYAPYDVPWQSTQGFVVTYLLTTSLAGMAGWLVIARGAARRRRWAAPVGTALFVLGLGAALIPLTVQEYGQLLVPLWLAVLGLLPSAVGVVATAQLWRDRHSAANGRP